MLISYLGSWNVKFEDDIEVQTSLQAYFDFKFRLSQSKTNLQAYFDFNSTFHRQEIV